MGNKISTLDETLPFSSVSAVDNDTVICHLLSFLDATYFLLFFCYFCDYFLTLIDPLFDISSADVFLFTALIPISSPILVIRLGFEAMPLIENDNA